MVPASSPPRADCAAPAGRAAIIDIGSNSIRLVVYDGPQRIPFVLFNEKVLAGLGRGLAKTGALEPEACARALTALGRFRALAGQMDVASLRTVATAAVRDAANGAAFLADLRALGLDVELLSGDEEAAMAGYGVLAGIPDADGVVGDLGGGSLELVRVGGGTVRERLSLPLGVLRLAAIRAKGPRALERTIEKALDEAGWGRSGAGLPLYLVGGSWRALARLDMYLSGFPLPIVHHYAMPADAATRLIRVIGEMDKPRLRELVGLASGRVATLGDAAALLGALVPRLGSSGLVTSAFGLREGLLHRSLSPDVRAQDPLLCAAREEAERQGRFPEHGEVLDRWIAPLFGHESAADARLRLAACLLADIGWRTHPEFRAERGLETALHGNWVGIDARGRAMMGRALWTSFGGGRDAMEGQGSIPAKLCTPAELVRAECWGLAMRLGQRLSGGVARALETSRLELARGALLLHLPGESAALYGESVERRHKALATALGARPVMAG